MRIGGTTNISMAGQKYKDMLYNYVSCVENEGGRRLHRDGYLNVDGFLNVPHTQCVCVCVCRFFYW